MFVEYGDMERNIFENKTLLCIFRFLLEGPSEMRLEERDSVAVDGYRGLLNRVELVEDTARGAHEFASAGFWSQWQVSLAREGLRVRTLLDTWVWAGNHVCTATTPTPEL